MPQFCCPAPESPLSTASWLLLGAERAGRSSPEASTR
jgi:hypothetical protein